MDSETVLIVVLAVCAAVAIYSLCLILGVGEAAASVPSVARASVGERTLAVVFERWDTGDTFTDGNLRERSCRSYTATKWRCRYVITGYARRVPTYVERGVVKVRCGGRCVAFRRSVTKITQPRLDRDLGDL